LRDAKITNSAGYVIGVKIAALPFDRGLRGHQVVSRSVDCKLCVQLYVFGGRGFLAFFRFSEKVEEPSRSILWGGILINSIPPGTRREHITAVPTAIKSDTQFSGS
jgi:hypothetical protein